MRGIRRRTTQRTSTTTPGHRTAGTGAACSLWIKYQLVSLTPGQHTGANAASHGRWDKHILVYGDAKDHKAGKNHPVVAFLAQDNHSKSLSVFKQG